jgi:hypothetical protein
MVERIALLADAGVPFTVGNHFEERVGQFSSSARCRIAQSTADLVSPTVPRRRLNAPAAQL